MKRVKLALLVLLLITSFLLFPFVFLLNKDLAYFSYKELIYKKIVHEVILSEKSPTKAVASLNDYVFRHLYTPHLYCKHVSNVKDLDAYSILIAGVAPCDQSTLTLATLLTELGINSRMVMTMSPSRKSYHTILEVFTDGNWTVYDPFYGLILKTANGKTSSYKDICLNPDLFFECKKMMVLKKIDSISYENTKNKYSEKVYYNNPVNPKIYSFSYKDKGFKRLLISKIISIYLKIFGDYFSNTFQDIYLTLFLNKPSSENFFLIARNYELVNRNKEAIAYYKKITDNPLDILEKEKSLFLLGVLYYKINETELSITTFNKLLNQFPDRGWTGTHWKVLSFYYIALDYEKQKNYEKAKCYYLKAMQCYEWPLLTPNKLLFIDLVKYLNC